MDALYAARCAILDRVENYAYDSCKTNAKVYLSIGNWKMAVYMTQICLFLIRLKRVSA